MMNQDRQRQVTLEDLLRLKRTERPPAVFWSQFDRELRAKQLSALVEKRPWWRALPGVVGGFARYHLPLGATAVFAVTLLTVLTVNEYRSDENLRTASNVASYGSTPAIVRETATTTTAFPAVAELQSNAAVANAADIEMASDATNPGPVSEPAVSPGLSQVIPALNVVQSAPDSGQLATSTSRFITANLALNKAAAPAVAQNLLVAAHGFESRAMPARIPAVEPLAQMSSPSDARRARLLNGAVMSVSMNSVPPARTTELRARQLSDEQLYDTISRFGARGNSLLVKF